MKTFDVVFSVTETNTYSTKVQAETIEEAGANLQLFGSQFDNFSVISIEEDTNSFFDLLTSPTKEQLN